MRVSSTRSSVLVFAGILAVACGGGQPEPVTPEPSPPPPPAEPAMTAEPAPEPAPEPEAPPTWENMNHDQRVELMKTVVVPKMSALFKEVDAKRYEKFGCVTCHGPGAKEGKFDMPNPELPKLSPKDHFAKHMKKSPKITKFMMEKVVPEMAAALGEEPFNPDTGKGFGCMACHTMADK